MADFDFEFDGSTLSSLPTHGYFSGQSVGASGGLHFVSGVPLASDARLFCFGPSASVEGERLLPRCQGVSTLVEG